MDVKLPDGTVIRNVPEGTTQKDLLARVNKQTLTDEQRLERISGLEAEQANLQNDNSFSSIFGDTLSDIRGVPEAALELATGGAATAAGGAAAIPVTAFDAITGGEDPAGAGRAVIEKFQDIGTFKPRTEVGQRASEAIAAPLESFEKLADRIGESTGESDDTLGATAVKTAILGAPALFGLRRGGVTRQPRQGSTPRQQVAAQAAEEGYVTPPSVRGEAGARGLAEGAGGKIKTGQLATERNQAVTNNLAARAVGLPEGTPLSVDILQGVRAQAGQAYEAIRGVGQVVTDTAFRRDLNKATAQFRSAARDFPRLAQQEIIDLVNSLRVDAFDAASGIDAMNLLRNRADVAFRNGDAALGRSYRAASDALESVFERHLSRGDSTALLDQFRQARQQIAETYSVEEALRAGSQAAGDVNAVNLASQLKKGKPLTGDLLQIAEFANAFPQVSRLFKGTPQAFSPLDIGVAAISGTSAAGAAALGAGPLGLLPLAGIVARPLLRQSALRGAVIPRGGAVTPSGAAVAGAATSGSLQN